MKDEGKLERWKVGRLEGWKVGRLEGWKDEEMIHAIACHPDHPAWVEGFHRLHTDLS